MTMLQGIQYSERRADHSLSLITASGHTLELSANAYDVASWAGSDADADVRVAIGALASTDVETVKATTIAEFCDGTEGDVERAWVEYANEVVDAAQRSVGRAAALDALRSHAVNDITRTVARDGITLTHAETDALGAETLEWMRSKLGLNIQWNPSGVVCTSGYQSTETAGDRQEV